MPEKHHVGIDEAARILGVSSKTIRRWIQNGKLQAQKIQHGRVYEYRVDITDRTPKQMATMHQNTYETEEISRPMSTQATVSPAEVAETDIPDQGQLSNIIHNEDTSPINDMSMALTEKDNVIHILREEINEKNRQIGEILLVLRQTQALLPPPRPKRKFRWPFRRKDQHT